MEEIRSSILLEKNELMYLIHYCADGDRNANTAALEKFTGITEADDRKAVAGLTRKNIVHPAGNRLVIVNLFDFYIRKLLSAGSMEMTGSGMNKLAFYHPGFILLLEEHKLSQDHLTIRAFRGKQDLNEFMRSSDSQ